MSVVDPLLRTWTAGAAWLFDTALGARPKVDLNGQPHQHDCSAVDVVTDLRTCLTTLLGAHARRNGDGVDYARLAVDPEFARHTQRAGCLQGFDPNSLSSGNQRLAFWINLYNSLTIDGVVRGPPSHGLRSCLARFRRVRYLVSGLPFSRDDIEHGVLRANRGHPRVPGPQFAPGDPRREFLLPYVDPRMHMALNCASRSCPPIAAYTPAQLDDQLDLACIGFINGGGARYDPARHTLHLSRIFKWYAGDFGGSSGVLTFVRRYADEPLAGALADGPAPRVRWQPYDWSLND